MRRSLPVFVVFSLLSGCNAPEPPESTGGVDVPAGPCGRGMVVTSSDQTSSTSVSILGLDGRVLSASFFSSASPSVGLSPKLGADVGLPTAPQGGSEIVLLDRYPASVLTWVDVASARARAQLGVGDVTNPHDYLPLGAGKAYVTRFDAGDVAIVDPSQPAPVGSIDLSAAMSDVASIYEPNPGRMLRAGASAYLVLEALTATFDDSAPSRIVRLDPTSDAITGVLVLDGVHGCSALAVAPNESELALGCSGTWQGTNDPDPATSYVVRVRIDGAEMTELSRLRALDLGSEPFGFGIDYASDGLLVALRFGSEQDGRDDSIVAIDLGSDDAEVVLTAPAFSLGDVRCAAECGVCFATDAHRGVVHHFELADGQLSAPSAIVADTSTGLAPRLLGRF